MFLLDRMLVGSIRFVLDKLTAAAAEELNDDGALKQVLLEAQMKLELGEMSAEEFAEVEREVLVRLREINERKNGPNEGGLVLQEGVSIVGATAELAGEIHELPSGGGETIEARVAAAETIEAGPPRRTKRAGARAAARPKSARTPRAGAVHAKVAAKRRKR